MWLLIASSHSNSELGPRQLAAWAVPLVRHLDEQILQGLRGVLDFVAELAESVDQLARVEDRVAPRRLEHLVHVVQLEVLPVQRGLDILLHERHDLVVGEWRGGDLIPSISMGRG